VRNNSDEIETGKLPARPPSRLKTVLLHFYSDYGMIFVLLLLAVFFSLVTWNEQHPTGLEAARSLVKQIVEHPNSRPRVLIIASSGGESAPFVESLRDQLTPMNIPILGTVLGSPSQARALLETLTREKKPLDLILTTRQTAEWNLLRDLPRIFPHFAEVKIFTPVGYFWPDFLKKSNLMAIADRIVVIAVIAIGMTMVIITGGIDLSVGSLVALAAVAATLLIRDYAGAENASPLQMVLCCLTALGLCAAVGLFSGLMVTFAAIPPFIVTLAVMLIASGLAFNLAHGESVYQVPDAITWLGRGTGPAGLPNTVVLMALLYLLAHVLMSRTVLGRYIYAVGGNREAARLSGVPVKAVLLFVYTLTGALAGLGGVIQASQLKSGAPTYGLMYELQVIAAVVVGGTSLAGGEGRVLGTLIGAFIIAVIQNGMNLIGIQPYNQKMILGFVILAAVLLDSLKKRSSM